MIDRIAPRTRRLTVAGVLTACLLAAQSPGQQRLSKDAQSDSMSIIQARDGKLWNKEARFRFVSFNIPNLHNIEDEVDPASGTPWRWPDEYEISDALESVQQCGGTVVRTYVLSVRRDDSDMKDHVYVRGPGDFNEEAFRVLDQVLHVARSKQIRVVIPFVDQWRWWGGIEQYAGFRGKQADAFWSDPEIRSDFKRTIEYVLSRVNSIDGVPYREDPAILGWETGNEISATSEWTKEIAAYCKQLDPNHLVIDGNSLRGIPAESLENPNIDLLTTHHYPGGGNDILSDILKAHTTIAKRKAYFVGEFGFVDTPTVERVLQTVVDQDISGALIWSLRFHRREGGFYWHSEPSGMGLFKAYHWPGFPSGSAYDETRVLELVRDAAHRIRGVEDSEAFVPRAPTMLPIEFPGAISWQGSAGAQDYTIERAEQSSGPWEIIASRVDDASFPYRPLYRDETARAGIAYWYRVIARAKSGRTSTPGVPLGPIRYSTRQVVDELVDLSRLEDYHADVTIVSGESRRTLEDFHRAEISPGEYITYHLPGELTACRMRAFFPPNSDESSHRAGETIVRVSTSPDGQAFVPVSEGIKPIDNARGDYGYLPMVDVKLETIPEGARYLKIEVASEQSATKVDGNSPGTGLGKIEVAWVELDYRDVLP
jgi:mannan endo-1,4-beta-mannosidase